MPPERFAGQSDVRTDIYGLGITLYEMLTLRPAFDQSNQSKLVAQILGEEPPRPRKLNPAVPRDLETIVLKAIAKEPAHRYASAAEMAADLKRFTEDRPIRARRVNAAERLWRWSWRNPLVASMAAAIFLLLVVVAAGSLIQNAQLLTANREATAKLWVSLRDRARAMRMSRHVGQRLQALRSITEAMRLPLPPGHTLDELRTEAVAALALPDIEFEREWQGGLTPGIVDMAFDENLENYARLAEDGTITVRRVADDSLVASWKDADDRPFKGEGLLRFSRDGRYLSVSNGNSSRLAVRRLVSPEPELCYRSEKALGGYRVDFTPDGKEVAYVTTDTRIAVVDLRSGRARYLPPAGAAQEHIAFAPDGRRFAIGVHRDGTYAVEVRDLATGKVEIALNLHPGSAFPVTGWHPDGQTLATTCDGLRIYIWDVRSGTIVREFAVTYTTHGINCSFDSTGRILASNDSNGIFHLWEGSSGQQLLSFPAGGCDFLRISSDDRLAVMNPADASRIQLLRLRGSRAYQTIGVGAHSLVAVHPEGRLLAVNVADRNTLALIDLATGQEVASLPIPNCRGLFWESSGALLTASTPVPNSWTKEFSTTGFLMGVAQQGAEAARQASGLWRWPIQPAPVPALRGQGKLAGDLTRDPWSLTSPLQPQHYRLGPPQRLLSNGSRDTWGFSADGQTIALSDYDRGAVVFHRGPPQRTVRLEPQQDVRHCAVSPDGCWVATGSHANTDGFSAKVWEAATGRLVKALPLPPFCSVAFSPDGRWLLTSAGGCRLWKVGTWTEGLTVDRAFGCFSPDSHLLAVEDSVGAVALVSTDTGNLVVRLESPEQTRLIPQSFTPDGTRLIARGVETQAFHIWDLREVRRGLAELGLDWDEPPYPPVTPQEEIERRGTTPPLQVTVDPGDLSPVSAPKEALAANAEAWHLATSPEAKLRDSARAIELAQKAVKLAPREAQCWNTLGVVHYRAGHWNDAIAALTKSMELQKGAFESYDTIFLAMAHWQLGEKEKARQWYDRAVQWMEKRSPEEFRRFRAEAAQLLGVKDPPK
jgi:WD40 repeat protein